MPDGPHPTPEEMEAMEDHVGRSPFGVVSMLTARIMLLEERVYELEQQQEDGGAD